MQPLNNGMSFMQPLNSLNGMSFMQPLNIINGMTFAQALNSVNGMSFMQPLNSGLSFTQRFLAHFWHPTFPTFCSTFWK